MQRPFEIEVEELTDRIEEMVDVTISDLSSEFLLMPKGNGFIRYQDFQNAYEVLKRTTKGFTDLRKESVFAGLFENSRTFGVLRAILGMTAPEWAELSLSENGIDIPQGAARQIDRRCREKVDYIDNAKKRAPISFDRIEALVGVALQFIEKGAPDRIEGVIHRLDKFDTAHGLDSLRYAAKENVPYAVLLYERYLGRPFATHRDAVSELVGEVMENAVEDQLRDAGVTYRKTGRAERIPGFGQAPDFCIPDEIDPVVIIEAKIISDDGTARDKVARIKELETQRNEHEATGRSRYEVVACIDGRGFRERREDMRQLLLRLDGKVFTTASLHSLITHTRIREYVTT